MLSRWCPFTGLTSSIFNKQSWQTSIGQLSEACRGVLLKATSFFQLLVLGGILLAAHEDKLTLQHPHVTNNSIFDSVLDIMYSASWTVIAVYGPQGELEKRIFIRELKGIKQAAKPQWLVLGDFNLIYKEQDKSNGRVNRCLMLRFRRALNYIEVKEVKLVENQFTWSNNQ
jgi:hypothetical protein